MAPALGLSLSSFVVVRFGTPVASLSNPVLIKAPTQFSCQKKRQKMAPALGFEPRTKWLTATYSTAELRRNIHFRELLLYFMIFKMQMPK